MMSIDKIIADLEGYYSDTFPSAGRGIMKQYLDGIDEDIRDYLFTQVLKTYERTKGRIAPGVAEFEKCKRAAYDELRAARAHARALAPPGRLQITEGVMAPEDVAAILGRLAAAKSVDTQADRV